MAMASLIGTGVTWHHVTGSSLADLDFIGRLFTVNPFDVEDCISQKQLPTVVSRKEYLFAILHLPRFVPEKQTVVPSQIGIFVTDKVLITVYQSKVKPLDRLFAECQKPEMAKELLDKQPGDLLWGILDVLVDYWFPMLDKVLGALEEIEDEVFDDKISAAVPVSLLRRDITSQRRILFPMEGLVNQIRVKARAYSKSDLELHYEDLHDRFTKVWHTLESAKERVEIFKDTDFVLSTEKTNKILAVLTIMFTFSIPATVVGTLMGMNVPLPGGIEAGPWDFWGTYTTFWVVLFGSTLPAAAMAYFFRRSRWL